MNSVDWTTALDGVGPAGVLLPLLFLTAPGLAISRGLRRWRKAPAARRATAPLGGKSRGGLPGKGGGAPGRAKRKLTWASIVAWLASVVTMLAMLAAGLGLVPLARVGYNAIASTGKWAPAITGLILISAVLAGGLMMLHDLKDGRVDHPPLWLAPAPILAVLILAAPVAWGQITDQAGHTAQMVFGGYTGDKPGGHKSKSEKKTKAKKAESHGRGANADE